MLEEAPAPNTPNITWQSKADVAFKHATLKDLCGVWTHNTNASCLQYRASALL